MNVVAYAGVPLIDSHGHALGTLCTIDDRPRQWSTHQVQLLKDIADSVCREIELARAAAD
jgi:GAF domain-containing protein